MEGLEQLMEFGIVGGAFVLMLFQSFKREERLMNFMNELKLEMVKMSEAYIRLSEDVEDIKHKIGNKEE